MIKFLAIMLGRKVPKLVIGVIYCWLFVTMCTSLNACAINFLPVIIQREHYDVRLMCFALRARSVVRRLRSESANVIATADFLQKVHYREQTNIQLPLITNMFCFLSCCFSTFPLFWAYINIIWNVWGMC